MKVEINMAEVARVIADLGCKSTPTITIEQAKDDHAGAVYTPHDGSIVLFLHDNDLSGPLTVAVSRLNRRVLHELRHHWQAQEWGGEWETTDVFYYGTREEVDAREFADASTHLYRTVRVVPSASRPSSRSGFGKLSAVRTDR